ncbi:MAG: histidine kinase dimerization/phospho-acceptor domain-containing protein, partial [Cyanobium sp.]
STAASSLGLLHHEFDEMRSTSRHRHAPVPLIASLATVEIQQDHLRIRWFDNDLRQIAAHGGFLPPGALVPPPDRRQQVQWLPIENGLAYWRPVFSVEKGRSRPVLQGYVSVSLASAASQAELARLHQGLMLGGLLAVLVAFAASQWMVAASLQPIRRQIEKLIRFTADASHELRHPLTAIRALIGSLRHGPLLVGCPPERDHRLSQIDQTSERMGQLLDDLQLLSRSDRSLQDSGGWWICLSRSCSRI